jgi:hypothetical protein
VSENLNKRRYLGHVEVDGRKILKLLLKVDIGPDSFGWGQDAVASSCRHCHDPSFRASFDVFVAVNDVSRQRTVIIFKDGNVLGYFDP